MTYELDFNVEAAKEWKKLDPTIRSQFAKKLRERLENPHVPSARLHNMKDCYKIKLRTVGYRLVYQVKDETVTVTVIAVGKRDGGEIYEDAAVRQ
ncbi:type II toxin-antitoxin system RelE family toxin [Paraburkholderia xenovorans]